MSRVYFHTQHEGEVELRGAERAQMSYLVREIAQSMIPNYSDKQVLAAIRPELRKQFGRTSYRAAGLLTFQDIPVTPYLAEHGPLVDLDRLKTSFSVDSGSAGIFQHDGRPLESFALALNTTLVLGSDPMCLMARLHGQCEIHAYVEGSNRAWMAEIIQQGLDAKLYRAEMGWEGVQELLRKGNEHPVVTSYSVCDSFPNEAEADWETPLVNGEPDEGAWYAVPHGWQWEMALAGLRGRPDDLREISPESLRKKFRHDVSMLDLFS